MPTQSPAAADSSSKGQLPLYDFAEANSGLKQESQEKRHPFLGILFTFASCSLLTLTAVIVKKLTYISSSQLSFVRNAGIFAASLPVGVYSVENVLGDPEDRTALLVGGFTGATSVYLYIMTYQYLPLLEATVVLSTVPVVTTVAACVCLKETCGLGQVLCILLSVSGVLLSVRLPERVTEHGFRAHDYATGLPVAVGTVVTIAATLIVLRHTKHVHFSVPMLYLSTIGMVENAAVQLFTSSAFESPDCGLHVWLYLLVGVFGYAGNLTYVLALRAEAAGIVSILLSVEIPLSLVLQVIFFDEVPDVYNITGAFLVMASVSVLGFRNWLMALPDGATTKEQFKFFLF